MVIVLNALAVDPRRSWKGPWRWYEESMLNCCVDLEEVKRTGITFGTFACLAKCQGLDVDAVYGSDSTYDDFRRAVRRTCAEEEEGEPSSSPSSSPSPSSFLVVSYTRAVVGQTGTGHFSPIGAYDEASDRVLVLDTARFKYGPHWVPLELMFDALLPLDPDTGRSRGYAVLSYDDGCGGERGASAAGNDDDAMISCRPLPLSVLFGSKKAKDYLRREYKHYLGKDAAASTAGGGGDATLESVVSFWTKNRSRNDFVWELVEPQLQPVELADVELVRSIRRLLRGMIAADENASAAIPRDMMLANYPGGGCCEENSHAAGGRALDISPGEVLYVVYLASLSLDVRRDVVNRHGTDDDDDDDATSTARKQILAEAALISFAIETCDADV